ncbi:MAG: type I restriction enzyme R subunit [bacterium]|jgi:type I restriction enzyme R subunit
MVLSKDWQLNSVINSYQGAVTYQDIQSNPNNAVGESTTKPFGSGESKDIQKSTLGEALKAIIEQFKINKEDAIVIRSICEEVSKQEEIKSNISANKSNILFLENYEPNVQVEVKNCYMDRDMWDQLDDPIYTDTGGIISLMGKAVIQIISTAA